MKVKKTRIAELLSLLKYFVMAVQDSSLGTTDGTGATLTLVTY